MSSINSSDDENKKLFLLSFFERDELTAKISDCGWQVSAARRSANLVDRFLASHAMIALIDVRKSVETGLAAIEVLAELAEQHGIALMALADTAEAPNIAGKCYEAGATHFLDMGCSADGLEQGIRFAGRYAERLGGDRRLLNRDDHYWYFDKNPPYARFASSNLRENLSGLNFSTYPLTALYRALSSEERRRVRDALNRLRSGAAQATVPHLLQGKRVIHHLHDFDGKIHGRIERLDVPEGENWVDRDLLSGLRKGSSARSWIRDQLAAGETIGLIALGLKNFSTINAAYGRLAGDQVLRTIGQRLLAETVDIDPDKHVVARIDGQNFILALAMEKNAAQFDDYAQRLLGTVFGPVHFEGRDVHMTARAGVAIASGSPDEAVLVRRATLALAEAMASDSLSYVHATDEGDVLLEQRLEGELAPAIEAGQIAIALQPQFRVDTGQLIGAEALARWNHPQFGLLGAGTLFAVAERAGLTDLLSDHIRGRALALAASWPQSLSFLRMAINVTAGDLLNRKFIQNILQDTERLELSTNRITLEIIESGLIADMDGAEQLLRSLREKGFRIAIDDFGTGYSSLAYLKKLPLDYLKLDSGLTGDLAGSPKDQVVVKSIIDMARSLDLAVIAEGVETEAQLKMLTDQQCDYFQGFLRSGPLLPEEFEVFALRSN